MITAGKSAFKVLLSFTATVLCLIGIGTASVAANQSIRDFEYSGIYKEGDEITITSGELGIRTASTTVRYVHAGDVLVVSKIVDDEGVGSYGFTLGTEFIELESAKCSQTTDGILVSGDGSNSSPFEFESHSILDEESKAVQDMIDALPGIDDVTEEDRADIEAAREAYEALTAEQKEQININKLIDVEEQIDKNKAAEVMELIDAIGEVELTDECYARIEAARDAYEELNDDQKRYVDNFNDIAEAEDKYFDMLRETVINDVADKINELPASDKLTIDDYYVVYDAGYDFYYELSEEEQSGLDVAIKKKLDDSIKVMYSLVLDAGNQLLEDYGDDLEELYDDLKDVVEAADAVTSAGKTPAFAEFEDLLWTVVAADLELFDTYYVVEGDDYVWTQGSTDPIVIRILQAGVKSKGFDDTFYNFRNAGGEIYVDGVPVDGKYFTAEEGSVIITIIPEFLNTLSAGEHTLKVNFINSVSVTSKFTIKSASDVPASGENVSLYVVLGAALTLLSVNLFVLRKRFMDLS